MMDEFELFRARASGCEITLHDYDKLSRGTPTGPGEGVFEGERRRSKRASRHSSRRNSRNKLDQSNETHLDVTFEIQPPSPILDKKENEDEGGIYKGVEVNNSKLDPLQGEGSSNDNGGPRRGSIRRSRHSLRCSNNDGLRRNSSCRNSHNNVSASVAPPNDTPYHENPYNDEDDNPCNEGMLEEEMQPLQSPAIYRVRSFTTKKGEIVSRGDSFKTCNRRNSNFLTVKNSPSFRRSSEAVTHVGSNLLVTSLQPGGACRRSSFTCLSQNNVEGLMGGDRRKSSFGSRLASSGSIKRASIHSGSIKLFSATDQVSNLSLEGSVLEEETVEEMVDEEDEQPLQEFQVVVMGGAGVGKTTLVKQLMTSEYLANRENNEQELEEETVISVMLDELETAIHFNEAPSQQSSNPLADSLPDAYLLIFSVTDHASFAFVKSCLNTIHQNDPRFRGCEFKHESVIVSRGCPFQRSRLSRDTNGRIETHVNPIAASPVSGKGVGRGGDGGGSNYMNGGVNIAGSDGTSNVVVLNDGENDGGNGGGNGGGSGMGEQKIKPVILVLANKQDLVRNRTVSELEFKRLTSTMRCRHAEVSALLDLNVDEALVDLVRWLRRQGNGQLSRRDSEEEEYEDDQGCFQRAMSGLCGSIFK